MVPKLEPLKRGRVRCFRAVLFRMVPKLICQCAVFFDSFRAVLFRMVPKLNQLRFQFLNRFRAVLFRMVPKPDDNLP